MRVNATEAKARLSALIDAALDGEEVVIAPRNRPAIRLTAVKPNVKKSTPTFGLFRGGIWVSPDFDDPLHAFAAYLPKRKR